MVKFICVSVLGGWQSAVSVNNENTPFGPIFNKMTDLWAWQRENLPK